jgi:thymidylate synthase ThyX
MENKTFTGKQCSVTVIEDSISQISKVRLTTLQLKYPRLIHQEFLTHRALSRNASSSRAIPTAKAIETVRQHPAFFAHLGKNQPGMQAHEEVDLATQEKFKNEWLELANIVADYSERWSNDYGLHKQVASRVLESFSFISVVVSATQWDNFFELRAHEDAQPEIQDLSYTMKDAMAASSPRLVRPSLLKDPRTWHLPYVPMQERQRNSIQDLLAMSAARCARVSYLTHNKENPKKEDDIALYRRLVESRPLHASPLEHQAYAAASTQPSSNFTGGWIQSRRLLELSGSIENLTANLHKI